LLEDGGKIAAEGLSTGDSGSITVNATDAVELKNSSEISTSSNNGEGGNINMTITRLLHLLSSKITTEIKLENAVGNGGSIIIDPIYIILQNGSRLDSSASFGDGGAIDLTADVFLQSSDSVLDPESKFGKSGVVEINAPQIDMSSGLVTLPSNFASAEGLFPKSCSEKTDTVQSSFTVKRKNGVPPDFRGIFSRP
jgi:large exoprotein involved in heme utilization and adhesion